MTDFQVQDGSEALTVSTGDDIAQTYDKGTFFLLPVIVWTMIGLALFSALELLQNYVMNDGGSVESWRWWRFSDSGTGFFRDRIDLFWDTLSFQPTWRWDIFVSTAIWFAAALLIRTVYKGFKREIAASRTIRRKTVSEINRVLIVVAAVAGFVGMLPLTGIALIVLIGSVIHQTDKVTSSQKLYNTETGEYDHSEGLDSGRSMMKALIASVGEFSITSVGAFLVITFMYGAAAGVSFWVVGHSLFAVLFLIGSMIRALLEDWKLPKALRMDA